MKSHNNMFGPYRSLSMKLKRHHELACSCQMLWMLRLKPLRRCLWQWFARLSLRLAQPDRGEQMTHFCWRNVIGKKLEYREIIFFHTIANPMGGFRLLLIFRTCCQSWSNTGGQCWSNNWSTWYMVYLEKSATRVLPCKLLQVSRGCPRQVYVKTGSSGSPNVFYVPSWRGQWPLQLLQRASCPSFWDPWAQDHLPSGLSFRSALPTFLFQKNVSYRSSFI